MRRGRQALLVLIASAALGAFPSHALAGSWVFGIPSIFSSEGSYPRVAMTPTGEAVVAYQGYGEEIRVSRRPPDGSFSGGALGEPVFPEPSICCFRPEEPAVAIDPAGDIVVVWQQGKYGSGLPEIYASFRPHNGSFSSPQVISSETATAPEVAIDTRGDATAVWLRDDGTNTIVEAATSTTGGPFSSPMQLSGDGGNASSVQVSMNPEGDAIASWLRTSGANTDIEVATRRAGGAFPSPDSNGDGLILGESKVPSTTPTEPPVQRIVMNPGPEAIAVWQTSTNAVQEARLVSGHASFGPVTTLGTTSAFPSIAMNETGEAVIDWPVTLGIDVVTAASTAAFGAPEQIAVGEHTPEFARISLAPNGQVTLAWLTSAKGRESMWWITREATVRPPGGVFAKASGVFQGGSGDDSADGLEIAGDSLGDTLAIWQETTSIGNNVRGLVYDSGPTLNGISVPSTAQVGQPVSFNLTPPLSLWQALTTVTWSFGDGATATGLSTSHTYNTPGAYSVTVSATDGEILQPFEKHVENTASQTITISAGPSHPTNPPLVSPAPRITHVGESHRTWREKRSLARSAMPRKRPAVGTTFYYTLNEQADVHFAFTLLPNMRDCTARSRSGDHHRCERSTTIGTLSLAAHTGANKLAFQGRLSSATSLAPGRYKLTITASNIAGISAPDSLSFTIVR
jgi:hypothetical protein